MKYLIVYDLRDCGGSSVDHRKMQEFLEDGWEAERVLGSKWVVDTPDSHEEILDEIKRQDFFRPGDGILVRALIEFGVGLSSYCSFGLAPTRFDLV